VVRGRNILSLKWVATPNNQIARDLVVLFSTFATLSTENASLTREFLLERASHLTGMLALANAAVQFYERNLSPNYAKVLNAESQKEFEQAYAETLGVAKKENGMPWPVISQTDTQKLYQNLEKLFS